MECRINVKLNKLSSEVITQMKWMFNKDKIPRWYEEVYDYTQMKHVYNKAKYPKNWRRYSIYNCTNTQMNVPKYTRCIR